MAAFLRAVVCHPSLVTAFKRFTDGRRENLFSKNGSNLKHMMALSLLWPVVWADEPECPRRFLVVGNWKMNGSREQIEGIKEMLCDACVDENAELVVAPPTCYLNYTREMLPKKIAISAQHSFTVPKGSFTGEVSPSMLKEVGATWVIIGHSERRHIFGETDKVLANKVKHAQCEGLNVIFCIGDSLEERECGLTDEVLVEELENVVDAVLDWNRFVIAYEPIWAIGTGKEDSPDEAQDIAAKIRCFVRDYISESIGDAVRIIYGGNVRGDNGCCFAAMKDIDGFLVGPTASMTPEFIKIANARLVEEEEEDEENEEGSEA